MGLSSISGLFCWAGEDLAQPWFWGHPKVSSSSFLHWLGLGSETLPLSMSTPPPPFSSLEFVAVCRYKGHRASLGGSLLLQHVESLSAARQSQCYSNSLHRTDTLLVKFRNGTEKLLSSKVLDSYGVRGVSQSYLYPGGENVDRTEGRHLN